MRDRQRLDQGPLAVLDRQNLDAPGTIEAHLAHSADEADDILGSVADQGAAVAGVFEQGADGLKLGVAELDTEDDVRVETLHQFGQRRVGAEDMPEVDEQPGGRVAGRSDELGALGNGADQGKGERFDGNAGSDSRRFVGDAAERFDKRRDVVDWGPELGPDLDERSPEFLCCLEQQLPDSSPGEVVAPPAGGEFDFDVLETGNLDLGPEGGEADRLANDLQIPLGETDARPAGRSDCAYAVDRRERADLWVVKGRNVAGAGPAGRDECCGDIGRSHLALAEAVPDYRRRRRPRLPNVRRRRRGSGRPGRLRSLG